MSYPFNLSKETAFPVQALAHQHLLCEGNLSPQEQQILGSTISAVRVALFQSSSGEEQRADQVDEVPIFIGQPIRESAMSSYIQWDRATLLNLATYVLTPFSHIFVRHGAKQTFQDQFKAPAPVAEIAGMMAVVTMTAYLISIKPDYRDEEVIKKLLSPKILLYILLSLSIANIAYQTEKKYEVVNQGELLALTVAGARLLVNIPTTLKSLENSVKFLKTIKEGSLSKAILFALIASLSMTVVVGFIGSMIKTMEGFDLQHSIALGLGVPLSLVLTSPFILYIMQKFYERLENFVSAIHGGAFNWKDVLLTSASLMLAFSIACFYGVSSAQNFEFLFSLPSLPLDAIQWSSTIIMTTVLSAPITELLPKAWHQLNESWRKFAVKSQCSIL